MGTVSSSRWALKIKIDCNNDEDQIQSVFMVLRVLVDSMRADLGTDRPLRVVDFGCGSGNFSLPICALFTPEECVFTLVDKNPVRIPRHS